jgi:hypothetical protein
MSYTGIDNMALKELLSIQNSQSGLFKLLSDLDKIALNQRNITTSFFPKDSILNPSNPLAFSLNEMNKIQRLFHAPAFDIWKLSKQLNPQPQPQNLEDIISREARSGKYPKAFIIRLIYLCGKEAQIKKELEIKGTRAVELAINTKIAMITGYDIDMIRRYRIDFKSSKSRLGLNKEINDKRVKIFLSKNALK